MIAFATFWMRFLVGSYMQEDDKLAVAQDDHTASDAAKSMGYSLYFYFIFFVCNSLL